MNKMWRKVVTYYRLSRANSRRVALILTDVRTICGLLLVLVTLSCLSLRLWAEAVMLPFAWFVVQIVQLFDENDTRVAELTFSLVVFGFMVAFYRTPMTACPILLVSFVVYIYNMITE